MTKLSARWVTITITVLQQAWRAQSSCAFLNLCNEENDAVLSRIVTEDDYWIHHYEAELNQIATTPTNSNLWCHSHLGDS